MCDVNVWRVHIDTVRPLAGWPRGSCVCCERQQSEEYHHEGRFRKAERHCLFKYTLAGEGVFRHGQTNHRLGPGRGFLCRISDPRTAYFYPPGRTEPWEFLYLTFLGDAAERLVEELLGRHGPVYSLPTDSEVLRGLLGFRTRDGQRISMSPARSAKLTLDLLAALLESQTAIAPHAPEHLAEQARRLVRENLHTPFDATQMARHLDVSREHLTRVFRARTGQTPYQYILAEKIRQACRLLKETSQPVAVIASAVGFEDPVSFSRAFRRVMQITPRRFRQVGSVPLE
jgi:AraC-like DNA-binding protein